MRLKDADYLKEALSIFNDGDLHFLNGIETAREIIDDAPTIDAEPVRRGKWKDEWFDHSQKIVCSNCNCFADKWTDYCPNCGAKMEDADA